MTAEMPARTGPASWAGSGLPPETTAPGATSELTAHVSTLEEEFGQRPPHTVAEACQRIEELTGVVRGREQVRLFLKQQLGLNWRKVAAIPVPTKQSVEEHAAKQADFLKSGT